MKKLLLFLAFAAVAGLQAAALESLAGIELPIGLWCKTKQPYYVDSRKPAANKVKFLGKVQGSGEITTVLCIVTTGDTSIARLKDEARRSFPDADDIINIEMDSEVTGVLGGFIFKNVQIIMRGDAVKYEK